MSEAKLIIHNGEGYRILMRDGFSVASDSDYDLAHSAKIVLKIREGTGDGYKICHIGGGLGIIPRLLGPGWDHVVLDRDTATEAFAPKGSRFLLGDWSANIAALAPYDVIVWDIAGVPPANLASYLVDSGIIVWED